MRKLIDEKIMMIEDDYQGLMPIGKDWQGMMTIDDNQ